MSVPQLLISHNNILTLDQIDELNLLCNKIKEGQSIEDSTFIPLLSLNSREKRSLVNEMIASACLSAGDKQKAYTFSLRAWHLSGFRQNLKPEVNADFNPVKEKLSSIRGQYKRLGLDAARQGNIAEAISSFNAWQYACIRKNGSDDYEYDPEVLAALKSLAQKYELKRQDTPHGTNEKIRIGYLLFGATHKESVIVKIAEYFGKYYNKQDYRVFFYLTEKITEIYKRPHAISNINKIKRSGCRVNYAPIFSRRNDQLIRVAREIQSDRIDILVTTAGLADFGHYFVAKISPVPVRIGLVQGPPPQYIAPDFDYGIAWANHPLIDCPTDCQKVNLEIELPQRNKVKRVRKSALGLPDESLLLISAGRYSKFQNVAFWQALLGTLASNENAYYIALGVAHHQIPFLDQLTENRHFHKIRFLSWTDDYLPILNVADIMIDTFPSGGGVTVLDAMALGLPVISFQQNYWSLFNQADWSPAEEIIPVPELIVARGDFNALGVILDRLITDRQYRQTTGRHCEEHVRKFHNDPGRMVKQCEEIYARTLAQHAGESSAR